MSDVPSNLIPTRITQLPTAPVASEDALLLIVYQGNNYQIRAGDLLQVAGVPTSRNVIAGTGLTGGGPLSSDVTLSVAVGGIDDTLLSNTGVTAGTYGSASRIPRFRVNAEGRVEAVTETVIDALIIGPQSANLVYAGPASGSPALTAFRALVTADLPASGVTAATYGDAATVPVTTYNAKGQATAVTNTAIALAASAITSGVLPVARGGTGTTSSTGGGAVVLNDTPTLITPNLGTPASGVATNLTGLPLSTGVTGLLPVGNGGTGLNTTPANGAIDIGNGVGFTRTTLTAGTGIGITNAPGSITIAVTAPGGTVTSIDVSGGTTGLTASGGPVTSSGTITLAGTLAAANGGTGKATYAVGDFLYADSNTTLAALADVATGNVLLSGGVNTAPAYGKVGLATHVTGTLPVANGGTGTTSSTGTGDVVLNNSPTLIAPALGTPSAIVLTSATGLPLTTGVTGILPVANGGTGVTSSTGSGSVVLNTSPSLVTPLLGTPTSGNLANCTFPTLNQNTTGTAALATAVAGGAASQLHYQSAAGVTAFLANGTAGQVLTSAGAAAPVWSGISGGTF